MSDQAHVQELLARLRARIAHLREQYYKNEISEIPDRAYDTLCERLERLEQEYPEYAMEDSPSRTVGDDRKPGFAKVAHRVPMLSLDNTYSLEEIESFEHRTVENLGHPTSYICELKYDGVSISLRYVDGFLVKAVTRGNGVEGDDVTANVSVIDSIPNHIDHADIPRDFEMRGEIFMPKKVLFRLNTEREELGKRLFANPRNAAAGSLKLKDPSVVRERGLECLLYYFICEDNPFESHLDSLNHTRSWGLPVSETVRLCHSAEEIFATITEWDAQRNALPFETDGVVIKVNEYSDQQELGLTSKSPRWAIAYKYPTQQVPTQLKSVDFQVGRLGSITPVANLEPVLVGGSTVRRASLHNADLIEKLDLHEGDTVIVEKAGEVIPYIDSVLSELRLPEAKPITFPRTCPSCGEPIIRKEGEAAYQCANAECPAQKIEAIIYYVSPRVMNIVGMGEQIVQRLYNAGMIRTFLDLYSLTVQQLVDAEILSEKMATKVLNSIEESKRSPLHLLILGLNIPLVGSATAQQLADHFQSLEKLATASVSELILDNIGELTASTIYGFFHREENRNLIDSLRTAGFELERAKFQQEDKESSGALAGMRIVFTGKLARYTRSQMKAIALAHGAETSESITKETTLLVSAGSSESSKSKKARKLGIRTVSEEEFLQMIGE